MAVGDNISNINSQAIEATNKAKAAAAQTQAKVAEAKAKIDAAKAQALAVQKKAKELADKAKKIKELAEKQKENMILVKMIQAVIPLLIHHVKIHCQMIVIKVQKEILVKKAKMGQLVILVLEEKWVLREKKVLLVLKVALVLRALKGRRVKPVPEVKMAQLVLKDVMAQLVLKGLKGKKETLVLKVIQV